MLTLVFLATVINYLDRQALSVLAPVLTAEFGMSNTQYSHVVFAFMLAYTLSNAFSGAMLDRVGTKLGYAICIAWWSAAGMLHALARGPVSLGVFRFLLGMGEAGNWPAGVRVVAEWFPVKERALASGIFNSGSSIGAVIAAPLVAWMAIRLGWQASFLVVGLSGFVWLLVWALVYRTPQSVKPELDLPPVPIRTILGTRWMRLFMLSKVFSDPVWYFYIFWFPQYLHLARGFDLAAIGKVAWIPFLTADAGNLIGGWLSAILLRQGLRPVKARKVCVALFSMLMTAAIPAVLTADLYLSIACVSTATMGYTGALANLLSLPADVFPKNAIGSVWGLASMGSGFGGMVFSLATGWAVDHYSFVPVFLGFGIMPLIAAALVWALPETALTR
ncbi:MAG: MFS transporter [Bryobacteraceae bacterium]